MPDEFHQAFFICKTDASNKLQKENLLNQMKAFPKINYCEVYDPSTSAYFEFYNLKRPHSSLDKMTPDEFYYDQLPQQNKVA